MPDVIVEIVRFVDPHQPGWVECVLIDAYAKPHSFIEKVPVVTTETLLPTSEYPVLGSIACEVLAKLNDEQGRSLLKIDTIRPWDIESTSGEVEFVILASQVRNS